MKYELKDLYRDDLTTVEIGNILEDYLIDMDSIGPLEVRKTKGSGRIHGDGDVLAELGNVALAIDAKAKKPSTNAIVKADDLNKIRRQAATMGRLGAITTVMASDTNEPRVIIAMEIHDFGMFVDMLVKQAKTGT